MAELVLRARLKIVWGNPCGFESHPGHIMPKQRLPEKEFSWTPQLAYVIGLLVTDGNLSKDGRHITMRSTDVQLLKTFKKCLYISDKICYTPDRSTDGYNRKRAYRVQSSMVQFYRWLLRIGLFSAKTYTIGAIAIPDEYFRDFLRGHLDGDGSVIGYIDRYNTYKNPKYVYTRIWLKFISASETHAHWLQSQILGLFGLEGHLWEDKKIRPGKTTTMWSLKFGKKESMALLNCMYYTSDLPCLNRKRKKVEKLLHKEETYWAKHLPSRSAGRPRVRYEVATIPDTI